MRRPILFIFLSFIFGIVTQYYFVKEQLTLCITFVIALIVFLLTITSKINKYNFEIINKQKETIRIFCLFLFVFSIGMAYLFVAENVSDPLEKGAGESAVVEGRIVTVQIKSKDYYKVFVSSECGKNRLLQVKGNPPKPQELVGKWIIAEGVVNLPIGSRNPKLFDYKLYLKTRDVRIILDTESSKIHIDDSKTFHVYSVLSKIKYGFLDKLKKEMSPKSFGLLAGMLFGDISFLDEDIYESFQKNGIAHILSVSGIHVGILYLYISRLFKNSKFCLIQLMIIGILVFYAALSEFSPSVVRSVVMIIIHMVSKILFRRYDFTTCAASSAMAMLLINPYYAFNVGFELSYLAIFCLAVVLPWCERTINIFEEKHKNQIIAEIFRMVAPLIVIQLVMAPLTAYIFNYFSITSFFINTPIIIISGLIIPIGIMLLPISYFGGVIFGTGAMIVEILVNSMIWLNEVFYMPGIGFFNTVSPSLFFILIFYSFVFFITSERFRILYQRRKNKRIFAAVAIIIVMVSFVSIAIDENYEKPGLFFIDVGQGDCLHIRTDNGKNVLIDGGGNFNYEVGKKTLLPYLLKNKVNHIDLAIVTHLHTDHYLGIQELSKEMEIKRLGTYESNKLQEQKILKETELKSESMLYLCAGERINLDKGVWIDVIYPVKIETTSIKNNIEDEKDENKNSLILKVYYKGTTVLMTGDLGYEGELEIINYYKNNPGILNSDILKIGHHGSRYSTSDDFLELVNPEIAIFQVGKNNFGHPHKAVIEKCLKNDIMVYRNDLNGAIIINEEEQKWHIKTML